MSQITNRLITIKDVLFINLENTKKRSHLLIKPSKFQSGKNSTDHDKTLFIPPQ